MLAAIMDPSEGQATVAGFDTVKQADAIKRRIGYMAQQFTLYGDLSVLENLDFYADVFGVRGRERRERTERLLRFARLTEFTRRRAANLSGGMKKKLALACSLIHQPEILYLDEPTTGVDPISRREFWDIFSELHIDGVSILVSTPYMDEAERCSRVGLMYQGRLVVCDTPEQIKQARARRPDRATAAAGRSGDAVRHWPAAPRRGDRCRPGGCVGGSDLWRFAAHLCGRCSRAHAADRTALAAQAIQPTGLRRAPARMEEAFMSLIRGQERERY